MVDKTPNPPKGSNQRKTVRRSNTKNDTSTTLTKLDNNIKSVESEIYGSEVTDLIKDHEHLDSIVRTIARRVSVSQNRLTGGNTLETMARLRQDSLLAQPVTNQSGLTSTVNDGGKTLKNALDEVEASMINDLFSLEKTRLDDYMTFSQVYELITQAAESVQSFCDNIISPDDFTKRDLVVHYEAINTEGKIETIVKEQSTSLIEKYELEDRCETAILQSLLKGDFFIAVLNLK